MVRWALLLFLCSTASFFAAETDDTLSRYAQLGERALAEGRYVEAEQIFKKLKSELPGVAEVCGKLGFVYFQEGKFAEAVPVLREGLKLKPSLPNAAILLSMSLAELGRYTEALPGLEKGFRSAPDPALKRRSGLSLTQVYTGLQRDLDAVRVA